MKFAIITDSKSTKTIYYNIVFTISFSLSLKVYFICIYRVLTKATRKSYCDPLEK